MIKLIGMNSEVEGRSFPLDHETILVGRDKTNHIRLNDVSVSTMHCMIISDEDGSVYVKDADSTNGTRINNQDVEEGPLVPGDTLEIGNVLFEVNFEGESTIHMSAPFAGEAETAEEAAAPSMAFDEQPAEVSEASPAGARRKRSLPSFSIPHWAYALIFTVLVLVTVFFVFRAVRMLIA